ncbi:MAG: VOC family protein [Thermoleophilia bacterium]
MFLGLRTTIYPAPDLAAQTAWWRGVLGADPYFEEPFYVGFSVGGFELGLNPAAEADLGTRTYWGVPDCSAAVAALTGAGATLVEGPSEVGGGIVVATVRAPGGEVVGVIENPHFDPSASG